MNGPLQFLTARKILPLLDLLAKFLNECSLARAPQIFADIRVSLKLRASKNLVRSKLKPRFKIFSVLFQRKGFPYGLLQAENIRSPRCSQSNFFISARARKKIAVLGMLAVLAKTIRHPFKCEIHLLVGLIC